LKEEIMGKGTALVLGLVAGGVIGFVVGRTFPPAPACSNDHLIVVDKNSKSLSDTCASISGKTQLVWQNRDQEPIDVAIPDSAAGGTGPSPNPYPNKRCDGVSTCWSGTLAAGLTADSIVSYSVTFNGSGGGRKIYGRIIIKP
jgi:hypothetical protein